MSFIVQKSLQSQVIKICDLKCSTKVFNANIVKKKYKSILKEVQEIIAPIVCTLNTSMMYFLVIEIPNVHSWWSHLELILKKISDGWSSIPVLDVEKRCSIKLLQMMNILPLSKQETLHNTLFFFILLFDFQLWIST